VGRHGQPRLIRLEEKKWERGSLLVDSCIVAVTERERRVEGRAGVEIHQGPSTERACRLGGSGELVPGKEGPVISIVRGGGTNRFDVAESRGRWGDEGAGGSHKRVGFEA
jgi:hypothetical protein